MTNKFSSERASEGYAYSMHRRLSILEIGVNILVLKQLSMITSEELLSLMRMIKSPDLENYTMAESIVKDLLQKADDEYRRKT